MKARKFLSFFFSLFILADFSPTNLNILALEADEIIPRYQAVFPYFRDHSIKEEPTSLQLLNPAEEAANIDVTFFDSSHPALKKTVSFPLEPLAKMKIFPREYVPFTHGVMVARSTQEFVAQLVIDQEAISPSPVSLLNDNGNAFEFILPHLKPKKGDTFKVNRGH